MPNFDFRIDSDTEGWIYPENGNRKVNLAVAYPEGDPVDKAGAELAAEFVRRWNNAPQTAADLERVTRERDDLLAACHALYVQLEGIQEQYTLTIERSRTVDRILKDTNALIAGMEDANNA